jgi:PAS domain S-box-containing protein
MVETLLRDEWPDCRIHRAASRSEFEAALEFEQFDLILSDHHMPGFDGLKALARAREHCPGKPFVFISGTIGEERAIDAMRNGADDYVIKDRPARLVPAIQHALNRVEEGARRRRMEEALKQNQERFRQIAENVDDLIAVLDIDGRRVYLNPAYRTVLGDSEKLRGTSAFAEIHPEDRARVEAAFHQTVQTGIGHRLEYRFVLEDQSIRYIESQDNVLRHPTGVVSNVLVVSRDVTARRAAEQRLREQASLLDKARDAIIATDLNHRITYWNTSAERILGWSAAEAQGRDLRELGLEMDAKRFATARSQVMTKGEWHGQFQVKAHSGSRVDLTSGWTLVRDGDGNPQSILLINTDVTESKQLEMQLLRSQRAESMGTLTGGVAHDLNNVLAPILMGAELLKMVAVDDGTKRIVNSIEASAQHGAALVKQLLGFARGTEGERIQVQPKRMLSEVGTLLRQAIPPRIKVNVDIKGEPPAVLADSTQLKQLLLNLCFNARDATPGEGTLTLGTEVASLTEDQARAMPEGRAGTFLHLSVADTGSGIPPEILDRIFDPFFTTKEVGKGTGLGLSMVRGIIKGHEGFLHVESTVGVGTTFHLYLPYPEPGRGTATPFNGKPAVKAEAAGVR